MDTPMYHEIIGYVASFLIAVSLMMSAVIKLRIINLIGAVAFVVYGILIESWPVAGMNAFIALINIHFLVAMFRAKEYFQLLLVASDSAYLDHFLRFYEKQIRRFQPMFDFEKNEHWMPVFILRNTIPAGLILGTRVEDDRLRLNLDFAIPQYRDFKIARFLFCRKKQFFLDRGIRWISSMKGSATHNQYLERMGFTPNPKYPDQYLLDLHQPCKA